jgi:hypothetical protein
MMEDNKAAKKFISVVIGEEVIELDFADREATAEGIRKEKPAKGKVIAPKETVAVKLLRLDFVAKIRIAEGYKTVIIEMQKSSIPSNIMRFRQYIGVQYRRKENSYIDKSGKVHAHEIYCIFFLGDGLNIKDVPVLVVSNVVHDYATGEQFDVQHEFIRSIHHKSWIIQIPYIPQRRRNDLEKLLGIFDQKKIFDNAHLLDIQNEDFPDEFRPIIRRLEAAWQDSQVMANMDLEDDYLFDIQTIERQKDYIINEERAEKEKALAEKEKERAEKEKALAEVEKECAEKEKERAEKEKERAEKEKALAEIVELKRRLANQ